MKRVGRNEVRLAFLVFEAAIAISALQADAVGGVSDDLPMKTNARLGE
jgi:hypothetical protein